MTSVLISASWLDARLYLTQWFGFAALFWLAAACRPRQMFLVGGLIGAGALGMAFHWAPGTIAYTLAIAPSAARWVFVGFVIWEALPFAVLGGLASRILRAAPAQLWLVPVSWVVLEQFWPKIFPWLIAHSQTDFVSLLQIAELVGGSGISVLVLSGALLPVMLVRLADPDAPPSLRRGLRVQAFGAAALLIAALTFGIFRVAQWERRGTERGVRVALVQVDPSFVDSVSKMQRQSQAVDDEVDLLCWPESALGTYSLALTDFRDPRATRRHTLPPFTDFRLLDDGHAELLAGGKSYSAGATEEGPFFQTAYLIRPDGAISARYRKRTLMPIGEYIPGQEYVPALRQWTYLDEEVQRGHDGRPVTLRDGTQVGVLICYEDIIAANARESVAAGATMLLSLMNTAAFESPVALEQHMRLALLRAVENRRCLARCSGTGVSCVIGPEGRIRSRAEPGTETTLRAELPRLSDVTLYTRVGHHFPLLCLLLSGVMVLRSGVQHMGRRRIKGTMPAADGAHAAAPPPLSPRPHRVGAATCSALSPPVVNTR